MRRLALLLALASHSLAEPSAAQVEVIGPRGTFTVDIVGSRRSPLIAVAIDEDGGVLRTGDGGLSYAPVDVPGASGFFAADFDPLGTCYVAGDSGVQVSTDGAQTFSPGGSLPAAVLAIGASRTVGGEVWALLANGTVQRSIDFGSTWNAVGSFAWPIGTNARPGIEAHPTDPARWLAHAGSTFWSTDDGGATSALSQAPHFAVYNGVHTIDFYGTLTITDAVWVDDRWFGTFTEPLPHVEPWPWGLISDDHGATWNPGFVGYRLTNGRLRVRPGDQSEIWMASPEDGLIRYSSGGQPLPPIELPAGYHAHDVAFSSDPLRPLHVATANNVGLTDPVAADFTPAQGEATPLHPSDFAVDPRDPLHLAVFAIGSGIHETYDGGSTWEFLAVPSDWLRRHIPRPSIGFDGAGRVLFSGKAHSELWVYKGGAWVELYDGVVRYVGSQSDPDVLYATLRGLYHSRLALSTDGGATWTERDICFLNAIGNCDGRRVSELALVERPGLPRRVVITWGHGGLSYTDDDGVTFVDVSTSTHDDIFSQSSRDGSWLAYSNGAAIVRTSDGFETTHAPIAYDYMATNSWVSGLAISSSDPDLMVGWQSDGEYQLTRDGGITWTLMPTFNDGTGIPPRDIAFSADETRVFLVGHSDVRAVDLRSVPSAEVCAQTVPNSIGTFAELQLVGSDSASANEVRMEALALPPVTICLPLAADATALTPGAGGSVGTLCLAGQIGRFNAAIGASTAEGTFGFDLDTQALPQGPGLVPALAGARWFFQCWYRDTAGGAPSSHFTSAVDVTWQP